MSDGDWYKHPAFGVALFAFAAAVLLALYQPKQGYCANGDCAPEQQLASGNYDAFSIVAPEPDQNPNRAEWRDEKDLQAQRDMATWAMLMTAISGVGLFVTAIGIVLVWKTLDANRDAVGAAYDAIDSDREVGEAQTRAYLSVTALHLGFDDEGLPVISATFENFGQSPALRAAYSVSVLLEKKGRKPKTVEEDTPTPIGHIGAGQCRTIQLVYPNLPIPKFAKKRLFSRHYNKRFIGVRIVTSFYDVFGNHFYITSGFSAHAYGFRKGGKIEELVSLGDEDAQICPDCQAKHKIRAFLPNGHS